MVYCCAGKLIENWKIFRFTLSYFIKAIDGTFYGFTGVINHLGCWENTRKACKTLAFSSWFTSFSHVLPTSRVGYHAGKPIESVVYCLSIVYNFISLISLLQFWKLTACYGIVYFRSIKPEPHPDSSFFRGLNLNWLVSIPILFMGESPPTPTPKLLKLFPLFYRPKKLHFHYTRHLLILF